MTEHHDRHTMERLREHLARADGELETARHFLDSGSAEGAEMDLVRAIASAREDIGEALRGGFGDGAMAARRAGGVASLLSPSC